LASAFIPTFARYQAAGEEREAWALTSSLLNLIGLFTLVLSLIAVAAAPWIVPRIFFGFDPAHQELIVRLTRIMLASPVFFGISAILGSALNARRRFFLTGLAPIVYNLCIAGGALVLAPRIGIEGLAWGVAGGALCHLLVQAPGLRREGMVYRLVFSISHPGVREVARLMGPRVLGLAAVQVNFLVTTSLASTLELSSLPALNYGWILTLLPLGIFGVAISSAVFPTMAAEADRDSGEAMGRTLYGTLRMILFLTIPAGVGLVALGQPLISLLFQRGRFDALSVDATYVALVFYAVGLFGHGMVEILTRAFYAVQDTRTPVAIGVGSMAVNVGLSLALMRPLGYGGLALSVSLAVILEAFLLLGVMRRRLARTVPLGIGVSAGRTCLASALMGAAILAFRLWIPVPPAGAGLAAFLA
ncbi:MAG: murein biosynthesis integral membrane protein MurJ, partial [Dehalococcoidia bacterium]|nr:murein biosynthesis integral membrane protein MurJ [Dehalococcoidia bacterium]